MRENGVGLSDFGSEDYAWDVAHELINKNMVQYGTTLEEHPALIDAKFPVLSRWWYVTGGAKQRTWSVNNKQELESGQKDIKCLADLKGRMATDLSLDDVKIKDGYPAWTKVVADKDLLKPT